MSIKPFLVIFIASGLILFNACDDLGLDPEVGIADCLTDEDKQNYQQFIANEKQARELLNTHGMDPDDVPSEEKETLKQQVLDNIEEHNDLRKGFECQYWGEDVDFLDMIATNDEDIDEDFLDPVTFKSLFHVNSADVLTAMSQEDWIGQNVYVFPGISRIPWEGASQANKEEALSRINEAYNALRQSKGVDDEVELFDPVNDYLYPHASFHQVFLVQYQAVLNNPDNVAAKGLVAEMTDVEQVILDKLIDRAPDDL